MLEFNFVFSVDAVREGDLREYSARGFIKENERVALIGPSGCGKSTLLKNLIGIRSPLSGFVRLSGRDLNQVALSEGLVGYAPQSSPLFSHLTVHDNILLSLSLQKFSSLSSELKSKKVMEALTRANLLAIKDKWPSELSGGEKKRVSLIRALIYNPRLLILDEPFSDLDLQNRELFKQWLLDECEQNNVAVIFVTHHQADLNFATRTVEWPQKSDEKKAELVF